MEGSYSPTAVQAKGEIVKMIPQGATVNMIDMSAHDPGRAHLAVFQYREQNYRPYIFQTNDFGENSSWLCDGA